MTVVLEWNCKPAVCNLPVLPLLLPSWPFTIMPSPLLFPHPRHSTRPCTGWRRWCSSRMTCFASSTRTVPPRGSSTCGWWVFSWGIGGMGICLPYCGINEISVYDNRTKSLASRWRTYSYRTCPPSVSRARASKSSTGYWPCAARTRRAYPCMYGSCQWPASAGESNPPPDVPIHLVTNPLNC